MYRGDSHDVTDNVILSSLIISQSGTAVCPWAVDTNIDRQIGFTKDVAEFVNCTTSSNVAMMNCLANADLEELLDAQSRVSRTITYTKQWRIQRGGGVNRRPPPPPQKKKQFIDFIQCCIIMLKQKAQIARVSMHL